LLKSPKVIFDLPEMVRNFLGGFKQDFTRLAQMKSAPAPLNEPRSHLMLKPLDMFGYSGLGDKQLLCSFGKTPVPHHLVEDEQRID
ncbi:MAG: hypothetical protein Q7V12_01615, partial [Deltaproteobacteria bacterium]|nr:hypothetical protein [Deltaproteobacteria bacterium]